MPSVSKSQQRFFGLIRAVQKGEAKAPSKRIAQTAKSISPGDAKDFAKTKHKGLPEKKASFRQTVAVKLARLAVSQSDKRLMKVAQRVANNDGLVQSIREELLLGEGIAKQAAAKIVAAALN